MNKSALYKVWQEDWGNYYKNPNIPSDHKLRAEVLKIFGGKLNGKKVLEVGAGSGMDLTSLVKIGAIGYALDFSENSLRVCQKIAKIQNVEIETVVADARRIPFRESYFDLVYSVGLIEHYKNPVLFLRDQVRVLKKGGYLIVDVPQKYNLYTLVKRYRMRHGSFRFGWETEYSKNDLKLLAFKLKLDTIGFYGRGSAFTLKFPPALRNGWVSILDYFQNTKLAPYVCLNIGII